MFSFGLISVLLVNVYICGLVVVGDLGLFWFCLCISEYFHLYVKYYLIKKKTGTYFDELDTISNKQKLCLRFRFLMHRNGCLFIILIFLNKN